MLRHARECPDPTERVAPGTGDCGGTLRQVRAVLEAREAMLQKDSIRSPRIHVIVSGRCKSMPCNDIITTNFVRRVVESPMGSGEPTVHDASDAGILLVSNSPEDWIRYDSRDWNQPENVYLCTIPISAGTHPFRLFAWHLNRTDHSLLFSIRARILNGSKQDEVTFSNLPRSDARTSRRRQVSVLPNRTCSAPLGPPHQRTFWTKPTLCPRNPSTPMEAS